MVMSGATSRGSIPLSAIGTVVLGPIPSASSSSGSITYHLVATVDAGPLPTTSCSVEFTLDQGPP
jgi:hypothetical protein